MWYDDIKIKSRNTADGGAARTFGYHPAQVQFEDSTRTANTVYAEYGMVDMSIAVGSKKDNGHTVKRDVLRAENFADPCSRKKASQITLCVGANSSSSSGSTPPTVGMDANPPQISTLADLLSDESLLNLLGAANVKLHAPPDHSSSSPPSLFDPRLDDELGVLVSGGVMLLSSEDIGKEYAINMYQYSPKDPNHALLVIAATATCTTVDLHLPRRTSPVRMRMEKSGNEGSWRTQRFDLSTAAGREAAARGFHPSSEAVIITVPVELVGDSATHSTASSGHQGPDTTPPVTSQTEGGTPSANGGGGGIFTKLFGTKKHKQQQPKTTVQKAQDQLLEATTALEKREAFLEKRMQEEVDKTKAFLSAKNKSAALMCMKRKKLYEQQLIKLLEQRHALEVMQISIQEATLNMDVVQCQMASANALHGEAYSLVMEDTVLSATADVGDELAEVMNEDTFIPDTDVVSALAMPQDDIDDDELMAELDELLLDGGATEAGLGDDPVLAAAAVPHQCLSAEEDIDDDYALKVLEAELMDLPPPPPPPHVLAKKESRRSQRRDQDQHWEPSAKQAQTTTTPCPQRQV